MARECEMRLAFCWSFFFFFFFFVIAAVVASKFQCCFVRSTSNLNIQHIFLLLYFFLGFVHRIGNPAKKKRIKTESFVRFIRHFCYWLLVRVRSPIFYVAIFWLAIKRRMGSHFLCISWMQVVPSK